MAFIRRAPVYISTNSIYYIFPFSFTTRHQFLCHENPIKTRLFSCMYVCDRTFIKTSKCIRDLLVIDFHCCIVVVVVRFVLLGISSNLAHQRVCRQKQVQQSGYKANIHAVVVLLLPVYGHRRTHYAQKECLMRLHVYVH